MSENITDRFDDLNDGDRVYLSDEGVAVKVRVRDVSPSPSMMVFSITGSWVDPETGQAKAFGAGHFVVEPHEVGIRPDAPIDLAACIEQGRERIVRRVAQAVANYEARQALTGIQPNP